MFDWLENETVVRLRPAEVQDRLDTYLDYTQAARTPVENCVVEPVTGMENNTQNRDAVLAQYSVTDLESPKGFWQDTDHVEIDGVEYQIEGHAQYWASPTGALSNYYLLVNRWEG